MSSSKTLIYFFLYFILMFSDFETTAEIEIPKNPLDRVIGQDEAIKIAKIVAAQKRHLLLVGAPGTGKSMLAQAIASLLPKPKYEIAVLHNPERPERPFLEVSTKEQIESKKKEAREFGIVLDPSQVPTFVSEKLGFRCRRCAGLSSSTQSVCPFCGSDKFLRNTNPFGDLIFGMDKDRVDGRVYASRVLPNGKEEVFVYEKTPNEMIRMLSQEDFKKMREFQNKMRKVLVPLVRSTFVQASGASETEFLGDVKHDPYGYTGNPGEQPPAMGPKSMAPYMGVIPGAIHEAHEGVLFIDELATLGNIQRYLLTAMQEKVFPITGRNPTSTGAVVKVDNVPCDFILVGAVNINELNSLVPALRSRIRGDGYEILMKSYMKDTIENRGKIAQFIAQEVLKDGKIPHADKTAVNEILKEAKRWAKEIDGSIGITLRLRGLSGLLKLAGDFAIMDKSQFISSTHVKEALKYSKSVEEQIQESYPNWWKAGMADFAVKDEKRSSDSV